MNNFPNLTCCIFEFAPHYRAPIFKRMDSEIGCDFFIGDGLPKPIKEMGYEDLSGFKKKIKNVWLWGNFFWQNGAIGLAFKPYKAYIITGTPFCISTWVLLLILKVLRKKSILWTHGWYGDETIIKIQLKKKFFNLASKIFLYGDYARDLMIDKGFDAQKLICIYNSLDYDNQLALRNKLVKTKIYENYFGNKLPVLIYIGRIQKVKRLDLLLHALKISLSKGVKYNLIFVGDNPEECDLEKLVTEYRINDYVWFYGSCYDENKNSELIYNADLCVSPGNVGLTAMHSLVYGTPVITHNDFTQQMPEFEVIRIGVNGDLFVANNSNSLAITIENWLLKNPEKKQEVVKECFNSIDKNYNTSYQIKVIKRTLNI